MRFQKFPISHHFKIKISSHFKLSNSLKENYTSIWNREKKKNPHIFDGDLFYLENFSEDCLSGHYSKYRYWFSQRILRNNINDPLISVAVTGIIRQGGNVLVGRRGKQVTQDAGLYDLVPSGGLSKTSSKAPNFEYQLKEEFHEELSSSSGLIEKIIPYCLMLDLHDHVLDIVAFINVSCDLSHFTKKNNEYDDFKIINITELEKDNVKYSLSAITREVLSDLWQNDKEKK